MVESEYTVEYCTQIDVIAETKEEAIEEVARLFSNHMPSENERGKPPYLEVISESSVEKPKEYVEVQFHPQAWSNGRAVEVEARGPTTWLIPLDEALDKNGEIPESNTQESDILCRHKRAPAWVRRWTGPFYLTIENTKKL